MLEYVPETVYRVARHFTKAKLTIPIIYVKVGRQASGAQAQEASGSESSYLLWVPSFSKFMLILGGLVFPALVSIPAEMQLAKYRAAHPEA